MKVLIDQTFKTLILWTLYKNEF